MLADAVRFVRDHWVAGSNVLVRCAGGRSRSAVILIVLLLVVGTCTTVDDALAFLQTAHAEAQPNPSFMTQLRAFVDTAQFAALLAEQDDVVVRAIDIPARVEVC